MRARVNSGVQRTLIITIFFSSEEDPEVSIDPDRVVIAPSAQPLEVQARARVIFDEFDQGVLGALPDGRGESSKGAFEAGVDSEADHAIFAKCALRLLASLKTGPVSVRFASARSAIICQRMSASDRRKPSEISSTRPMNGFTAR